MACTGTSDPQGVFRSAARTASTCRQTFATVSAQFRRPTWSSSGPRSEIGPGRLVWASHL
jgi:hypothetical protein